MVKETRFRHHPVRIENGLFMGFQQLDILGFRLDLQLSVLTSDTNQSSTVWQELTLNDLVTVPTNAVAIVISVEANDAASAANVSYMGFCPTGRILAGRCQYVYPANVNDRKGARIVMMELSDDTYPSIGYRIVASDGAFDYSINLIGWLIGGTRVSRLTIPAEDLFCKFRI